MNNKVILLKGVDYGNNLGAIGNGSGIANLPSRFGIEWGFVKYQVVLLFSLCLNGA